MAVTRGPIPKRDAERRRRNAAEVGTTTVEMTGEVIVPDADPNWHRLAREWYESLRKSGQHKYMEPSDWAAARILAFSMTKQLASSRPSSQWCCRDLVGVERSSDDRRRSSPGPYGGRAQGTQGGSGRAGDGDPH